MEVQDSPDHIGSLTASCSTRRSMIRDGSSDLLFSYACGGLWEYMSLKKAVQMGESLTYLKDPRGDLRRDVACIRAYVGVNEKRFASGSCGMQEVDGIELCIRSVKADGRIW